MWFLYLQGFGLKVVIRREYKTKNVHSGTPPPLPASYADTYGADKFPQTRQTRVHWLNWNK